MHILLTGASSGIGRELAQRLAKDEHAISLCGRSEEKLQTTLNLLPKNTSTFSQAFCISQPNHRNHFFTEAVNHFGPVNILINCAGLNNTRAQGHELTQTDLEWMMAVNFYAPVDMMKLCTPAMIEQKTGTIINILSTTCLFSNTHIAGYTASKAALDAYSKVMRKELRPHNINMLSVYPGGVDTDFRTADRPQYLSAASVAQAIHSLLNSQLDSSANTHIHELVLRPTCEENFA